MTVVELIAAVASRWPALHVEADALELALRERGVAPDATVAADVALVCALSASDHGALAVFESEIIPAIQRPLVRIASGSMDLVEEGLQMTRAKLLVPAPAAKSTPRITEFRGRGSLVAWIQVVAIREVLMLCRRERRNTPTIEETLLAAVETDPVVALTKRSYSAAFTIAFHAAFAELQPRQRALLRLTFAEAAGTEKLAAMYGVHRVTMFRWLADAREDLLDKLRVQISTKIGIAAPEIDSLIRAVASSFDLGW